MKYRVGDIVRIVRLVGDDPKILGSIGIVERFSSYNGSSMFLKPANSYSLINREGWWVYNDRVELFETTFLPEGITRCKECRDTITSNKDGLCCDCVEKRNQLPF
jgi:hypothetical protein